MAIIILQTQKNQQVILQAYDDTTLIKTLKWIRNKLCPCCEDDYSKYTFERAPEPTDIYWENLPISYW